MKSSFVQKELLPDWVYKLYDKYALLKSMFPLFKLHHEKVSLSCNPFFIIGSGRSGNTLLRAILANNSKILIPPESYVLGYVVRRYRTLTFLPWRDLVNVTLAEFQFNPQFYHWEIDLAKTRNRALELPPSQRTLSKLIDLIYCFYAESKGKQIKRWGDKTPLNTFNLERLRKVFPNAQYIHIIRDGRDVVSSYLEMGRYSTVEEACERWKKSIALAERFKTKFCNEGNYLEVMYEEFVLEPQKTINKVCSFLQIEYETQMQEFYKDVKVLGDTKEKHHKNLKKPISSKSIGQWNNRLSKDDQAKTLKLIEQELFRLGYIKEIN